jgi:D-glycero-D-manno-heptose 1,7-bisphosphate phosphatase
VVDGVSRRAVFFDRDGVLSQSEVRDGKAYAPRRLAEFRLLPDAANAARRLADAGFILVVVTNQPDVGNGLAAREEVMAMNQRLAAELPIALVKTCFHGQSEKCDCRKPKSGMIYEACDELSINPSKSYMVGDRWSDVECGRNAGCFTVFIDRHYDEALVQQPDVIVESTGAAADIILNHWAGKL